MEDEPSVMKFWRSLFGKKNDDIPEVRALAVPKQRELDRILSDRRADAPSIVKMLGSFYDGLDADLDTYVLEKLARKYKASAAVWEGINDMKRLRTQSFFVEEGVIRDEEEKRRQEELRGKQHQVKMAGLDDELGFINHPMRPALDDAWYTAEIKRLASSSDDDALKHWRDLLDMWSSGNKGQDDFIEETDRDIDARYHQTVAAIPKNAPNRARLRQQAEDKRKQRQQLRDKMATAMATYLADKHGAKRRRDLDDGEENKNQSNQSRWRRDHNR